MGIEKLTPRQYKIIKKARTLYTLSEVSNFCKFLYHTRALDNTNSIICKVVKTDLKKIP